MSPGRSRDVTRRGADVAARAVWSLPDLQELFDEWVVAGWQNRPHDGLRHPFSPDQAASPNDAYAALVAAAGYVPVSLTGEYLLSVPAGAARVAPFGGSLVPSVPAGIYTVEARLGDDEEAVEADVSGGDIGIDFSI